MKNTKLIGMIADHPTPKIHQGDGIAYTVNSRDYKGVMVVVLQENSIQPVKPKRSIQTGRDNS